MRNAKQQPRPLTADEIDLVPRRFTSKSPADYLPYEVDENLTPWAPPVGEGYKFHVTGLTHDERGYPDVSPECQATGSQPKRS